MFMTNSSGQTHMYQPMSSQYSQQHQHFQQPPPQQQPQYQQQPMHQHPKPDFDNFEHSDIMGGLEMPPDISEIDADIRKLTPQ